EGAALETVSFQLRIEKPPGRFQIRNPQSPASSTSVGARVCEVLDFVFVNGPPTLAHCKARNVGVPLRLAVPQQIQAEYPGKVGTIFRILILFQYIKKIC